jgi:hypothetical protein
MHLRQFFRFLVSVHCGYFYLLHHAMQSRSSLKPFVKSSGDQCNSRKRVQFLMGSKFLLIFLVKFYNMSSSTSSFLGGNIHLHQ